MPRRQRFYICLWCKCDFSSIKMYLKYCSKSCAKKHMRSKGIGGRRIKENIVDCPNCKKTFHIAPSILNLNKSVKIFCSISCKNESMKIGETSWGFLKKGIPVNNPYIRKVINGKRYYFHRYVMEQFIGRPLKRNEHIHHKNGDQKDNRIENLEIVSDHSHQKKHKLEDYKIKSK